MAYYSGGITARRTLDTGAGTIIRVATTHVGKIIQLYVSGELLDWAAEEGGQVEFEVATLYLADIPYLLAVDPANAETNYWSDAFPTAEASGNRLKVRTPQLMQGFLPWDEWVVYRGDAGDESADVEVHRQRFYPQGRRCGGYGFYYGWGGYGFDGHNLKGYGYNYGYGEYGFDCAMLEWTSEPLPPGVYPIKVIVEDRWGNESTATETTITLTTYPRPATGLTIGSYTQGTDTLAFSWTASPDIS